MYISNINFNKSFNYNSKPKTLSQSFTGKSYEYEYRKYWLSDDIKNCIKSEVNSNTTVSKIIDLKNTLMNQIIYDNGLTNEERIGLIADFVTMERHGFMTEGGCWGHPSGKGYTSEQIKRIASNLGKTCANIDNLDFPYRDFANTFLLNMSSTHYHSQIPLAVDLYKEHPAGRSLEGYMQKKSKILTDIKKLIDQNKDDQLIKVKINELKKMLVEQINSYDDNYSNRACNSFRSTILTVELAIFDKIINHYKRSWEWCWNHDMSKLPVKNYGIDDIKEPFRAFAKQFISDPRMKVIQLSDYTIDDLVNPQKYII